MTEDKRSARIRQTPKHLEKMLFINHKEEQGLQRRLEGISADSRIKGRQLDKERIKVRNEWRFYSRLNYPSVSPLLGQIPTMIQKGHQSHRSREPSGLGNDYLLREYRRNSQVIPSILSAVGKEMELHHNKVKENEAKEAVRKERLSAAMENAVSSKQQRPHNKRSAASPGQRETNTQPAELQTAVRSGIDDDQDDGAGEANRITSLVREITKLRNDMLANKKIDLMRSKVSFPDLLRRLQEKEKNGSESETYTDGTCVLLRRKMQRMRKHAEPETEIEVFSSLNPTSSVGNGHSVNGMTPPRLGRKRPSVSQSPSSGPSPRLPSISPNKNASSMTAIARLDVLENDERELKRQLDDQERHQTEMKVAIETKKYRRIQERVGEFLSKNKVRASIPLVYESNAA